MAAGPALFGAAATSALLPAAALIDAVAAAMLARRAGTLLSPTRLVLPLAGGGSYLAMPAVDERLAICKVVSVHEDNAARGLPTIHAQVLVSDAQTGQPLALFDGATVTARRTAAVSLLAIRLFAEPSRWPRVALIGAGPQALEHARMLAETGVASELHLAARRPASALRLAQALAEERISIDCIPHATVASALAACDALICLTTATTPVLPDELPADMLVIGTGSFKLEMAELSPALLARRTVVVDDLAGARHEAGDLLQAGIDWQRVHEMADWLGASARPRPGGGVAVKTVGQAAWDLAAAHVAMACLESSA